MPFARRATLILIGTLAWFVVGPRIVAALGAPPGGAFLISMLILVVVSNGMFYYFLRCPNCSKWACLLPNGRATAFPGTRCRHCQQPY